MSPVELEELREPAMTLDEFRLQLDGPAESHDRVESPPLPVDRDAQIELRRGEIVLLGDRQLETGFGLRELTGVQQRPAERVP